MKLKYGFKPERIVSVFGTLGVGKSSCLNALMSREQLKDKKTKFISKDAVSGVTQTFNTLPCPALGPNVGLMDTPGLNDPRIPLN